MNTIYWKLYKTEKGEEGTAYYFDSYGHRLFRKNPFIKRISDHIVKIDDADYFAKPIRVDYTTDEEEFLGEQKIADILNKIQQK